MHYRDGSCSSVFLLLLVGLPSIYAQCIQGKRCELKCGTNESGVCEVYRQDYGVPIPSYTASQTCGKYGPIVLEDKTYIKLLASHVREKLPERSASPKGWGAHGYLEVTHDIGKYTKAAVFSHVGRKTEVFCRLSMGVTVKGAPDTSRDFKDIACKFYTTEGNWDLLSINQPVFFIRDPMLFPILGPIRDSRNTATNVRDLNYRWDYFTQRQEIVPSLLFFYSDVAFPQGFRHLTTFSVNAFKFVNKDGHPTYVKFSLQTNQGRKNFTAAEAKKLAVENPDYYGEDLYKNIKVGNYPSWTLCVQLMSVKQSREVKFHPFDATVLWPEREFPCRPVGKMVLNKNPEDFFAEVEQVGYSPGTLPPGIEPSPDLLLQGRLFAYDDAQRYRIGINSMQLPINFPKGVPCCKHNLNRDGFMDFDDQDGEIDIYPSSFTKRHTDPKSSYSSFPVEGTVDRHDFGNQPDWEQTREIYAEFSDRDKKHLAESLASDIKLIKPEFQCKALKMFKRVSRRLSEDIAHYGNIIHHVSHCF